MLYENRLPSHGSFKLDLTAIRHEATRLPGPLPKRIEIEQASHTYIPRIGVVAGASWGRVDMVRASYRAVYPDPGAPNRTVMIDSAFNYSEAHGSGAACYDRAAWSRIQRALDGASAIVATHEHGDHINGIIAHPHLAALLPRLRLTAEQLAVDALTRPRPWPQWARRRYRPLVYQGPTAVAPGVVLIKAPGHTPGSQMICVRLAGGREYIFMGDIASLHDNVTREHMRPHYTSDIHGKDDRTAVLLQLHALHALAVAHPEIVLVPGHDSAMFEQLIARGLLTQGFHLPRVTPPVPTAPRRSVSNIGV